MGTTITNNFAAVCRNVAKDNGLDAAILVTVKADTKSGKAEITLHGDGPNQQAVDKLKSVVATAIAESIAAYKAEKAKREAKREAANAH